MILTVFRRPRSPRTISIAPRRTPKAFASASITAAFASPSTGGAVTATRSRSPCIGPTVVREARGTTSTSIIRPSDAPLTLPRREADWLPRRLDHRQPEIFVQVDLLAIPGGERQRNVDEAAVPLADQHLGVARHGGVDGVA